MVISSFFWAIRDYPWHRWAQPCTRLVSRHRLMGLPFRTMGMSSHSEKRAATLMGCIDMYLLYTYLWLLRIYIYIYNYIYIYIYIFIYLFIYLHISYNWSLVVYVHVLSIIIIIPMYFTDVWYMCLVFCSWLSYNHNTQSPMFRRVLYTLVIFPCLVGRTISHMSRAQ